MKQKPDIQPKVAVAFVISLLIGVFITFINRELEWSNLLFGLCATPVAFLLSKGVFLLLGVKDKAETKGTERKPVKEVHVSDIGALFAAAVALIFSLVGG